MLKRKAVLISCILILLACLIFFLKPLLYHFHSTENLDSVQEKILIENAAQSLKSLDVPVGALMIYNDTILSAGYNTVYRDSNAGGHAEINAISNAIRKIGFEAFSKLDRKKLVLVSTFEPCMMCKGAIIEYGIRRVYFMKGKGLMHWLQNDAKEFRYEWNKYSIGYESIQDSLFMLHPQYRISHPN